MTIQCADGTDAAQRLGQGKRRRAPKGPGKPLPCKAEGLSAQARRRLHNHLTALTCSYRWHWDLYSEITAGKLPFGYDFPHQAAALYRAQAYPPGGQETAMQRCKACGQWIPPSAMGSANVCYDCFLADLPLSQMCRLPSSPGFHTLIARSQIAGAATEQRRPTRKLEPVDETIPARQTFRVVESLEQDDGFRQTNAIFPVAGTPDEATAA